MASSHGEQRGPHAFLPIHLESQAPGKATRKIWFLHRASGCCLGPPAGQHVATSPLLFSILLGALRPPSRIGWEGRVWGLLSGFPSYPVIEGWPRENSSSKKKKERKKTDWDRIEYGLSG